MRNVIRLPKPRSLKNNASRWKRELLSKVEECRQNGTKVLDKFFDKYKQDDVKQTLGKMYNGLCCYCESPTGIVEFGHIEHRMPKKKYPEHTFAWHNLHLACTYCNVKKSNKYSEKYPILDAAKDRISDHMTYKVKHSGVWWTPRTNRGRTTEEHVDLNRKDLREKRRDIFLVTIDVIGQVNQDRDAPNVDVTLKELDEMCNGQCGSVIDYARRTFLR